MRMISTYKTRAAKGTWILILLQFLAFSGALPCHAETAGLPVYWWQQPNFVNFGDYLSLKIVERIVGGEVKTALSSTKEKKLLALGSFRSFGKDDEILSGLGVNGKVFPRKRLSFQPS